MRESKIEAYLRQRVKEAGGLCWKFTSPGLVGVPDRIVVMPGGRVYFVELKAADGVLSEVQHRRRDDLEKRGAQVWAINSIERVDYFMLCIDD